MASLLKGSAFITGAASGIGKYTAFAFARHGITRLALADVNKTALDASVAQLKEQHPGVEILPLHLNVRDGAHVKQSLTDIAKAFGRLDIAVNNAGISGSGKLTHETEDEEIDRMLDINLRGVYRCQKEELTIMVKQEDLGRREGRGRIVNVASMYGLLAPNPLLPYTSYTTAKHGVIGLTKGDANAYAAYNIRINAICPGYVATPLIREGMANGEGTPLHKDIERSPIQRLAEPDEIAEAIVWLSSPMNSFTQGSSLVVDGGITTN